jgi:competence protein ComEC
MAVLFIPLWKEAPFIRIVLPFIAGIVIEEYLGLPLRWLCTGIIISFAALLMFSFTRLSFRFKYAWVHGLLLNALLILIGALIIAFKKAATLTPAHPPFIVSIQQPLSEKPKSWKAVTSTNIIIYFKKDSLLNKPAYGDRIAFTKPPENNRVFLNANEFIYLNEKDVNAFKAFLFDLQAWVVKTLQRYIPGKKECGLAEALLIGYKDDLDRDLMKAYSNTGVVHVVAISGLHLGLIYMLLKYLCYPFSRKKAGKWITPLVIISGLWVFSLLAGGSPSVMRSAVMFTFIVAGESFRKKTSVYNNLAASAFFLLCYDPRWLWDIGFQLSYTALLSIVIFMKPIFNLFAVKTKLLDAVWKLNAVTLAAQILTTPVCVFYFNQFPNLFLFTNFIAVPVSSIILVGEIALCVISPLSAAAGLFGASLSFAIKFMNDAVEWLGSFSFSTTSDLYIDFSQLVAVYAVILFTSCWLLHQKRIYVFPALIFAVVFCSLRYL